MNTPITFPPVLADDVLDDPLIIEAEVEGYLVRKVFVDHGAVVQVMFEHCFDNLPSSVKARLTLTQPELVGFSIEQQLILIGKVELEVAFGSKGLYRRMIMKFTVVRVSSPYNIILGRTRMKELRAVLSTIHAMMKFPTPREIATLVARTTSVFKCQWNLEVYVDDMVIKSKMEREIVMDIPETFDNLWKINIKLNPKKCSFSVIEGKFLGYMVTSEGIKANLKKYESDGLYAVSQNLEENAKSEREAGSVKPSPFQICHSSKH
ncbi:reverse transcriptase domain-containing protein [Tanacetum coccineum]|uniref:Reverse transcriptase domain-containing protein n=1 Tax=Tanacetum coccineum TaxID=301880 RepID=A0ABQ5ESZ1_9ASTR